ncbi:MAG: response regulator transcription factor [Pirellulales bacterium]|nr:response regulator transcription factor [Pirellulales bacterium]
MHPTSVTSDKSAPNNPDSEFEEDNPLPADEMLDGGACDLPARASAKTDARKILRLVVIDNHELFREGLLRLLVMEGDFSPVTGAYAEARSLVRHFWPDLVLFGLGSAKQRGIDFAQSMRREFPAVRLLLLDESVRARHVHEAVAMKAEGYWTKHANFAKIVAAMRCVASGRQSFCPEVEKHLRKTPSGLRLDPPHERPTMARLTTPEADLFLLLAQGHTLRQSAERLGISEKKAEDRRARLMHKLKVQELADLTRLAIKEGLLK